MSERALSSLGAVPPSIHPLPAEPVQPEPASPGADALVDSYRRLADVFHLLLAEQSLDLLLERVADTLEELVPHDTLTIYEADATGRLLRPVLARDEWADQILQTTTRFGEGLTGWAVEHREALCIQQAHLDPRVKIVPGTPAEDAEALISVPLIARDSIKGALNIYRLGDDASFSEVDFELAKRFGDAAALALDNAQIRARLEHQAQTDALTGLFNHRTFHERLRSELRRASRSGDSVSVLMLDLDDFKRLNDVHGHGTGDEVLRALADALRAVVREEDIVCRLGGEEFAVIMAPCDADAAYALAERLQELLCSLDVAPASAVEVSIGLAQGPEHAMNSRELAACAEDAMMTAKAHGKNRIVRFGAVPSERPESVRREIRSMAHVKMLQSLAGKLNRLNNVRDIGAVIADELRSLIDYHNCRVFVVDGEDVLPIAFRGEFVSGGPAALELLSCKVGEGITGHVAATRETLILVDAARSEHALPVEGTEPIQESLVAAPLCYGSRTIGVIVISKLGVGQFDEDDAALVEVLGGHAAIALENARLYEAQRRDAESATAMLEFSRELAGARTLEETLSRIVERTAAIHEAPRASVWLQDRESAELVVRAAHGYPQTMHARLRREHYAPELVGRLLEATEPFFLPVEELGDFITHPQAKVAGVAIAPLRLDDGRRGCIAVTIDVGGTVGDRDLRLLDGLAHQAQLAIANADGLQDLEETFLHMLEALVEVVDGEASTSGSGARAVADLAVRTAREVGLAEPALRRVELAALLRDVGNIGIPTGVLGKLDRLDAAERRLIERHPALGSEIVAPVDRLQEVAVIVRYCHERWDGRGYPDGKAGEAIPLEARIVHVCDAFQAMTSDRPYRRRLPVVEAARRLRAASGKQFDPAVVDACLRVAGTA